MERADIEVADVRCAALVDSVDEMRSMMALFMGDEVVRHEWLRAAASPVHDRIRSLRPQLSQLVDEIWQLRLAIDDVCDERSIFDSDGFGVGSCGGAS
jgi:hypothetical protein